jgi:hypothetical protein
MISRGRFLSAGSASMSVAYWDLFGFRWRGLGRSPLGITSLGRRTA